MEPGVNVKVPLWLALTLKSGNKVRIVIPKWLRRKKLDECIRKEKENELRLEKMPFHFAETAEVLLRDAEEFFADIGESPETISHLIQDLLSIRENKLKKMTATCLKGGDKDVLWADLGALEVSMLREGFLKVLDEKAALEKEQSKAQGRAGKEEKKGRSRAVAGDAGSGAAQRRAPAQGAAEAGPSAQEGEGGEGAGLTAREGANKRKQHIRDRLAAVIAARTGAAVEEGDEGAGGSGGGGGGD